MTESTDGAQATFLENLVRNLEKNGFPERRVAFPIERMYEAADARGLSFNRVLDDLAARGIAHEKTSEKVIFFPQSTASGPANPFAGLDLGTLEGVAPEQMIAAAAELLRRMTPEQLESMRSMVEALSDAEKADLVERARKLGLD
jgi:hypothetical protein